MDNNVTAAGHESLSLFLVHAAFRATILHVPRRLSSSFGEGVLVDG